MSISSLKPKMLLEVRLLEECTNLVNNFAIRVRSAWLFFSYLMIVIPLAHGSSKQLSYCSRPTA